MTAADQLAQRARQFPANFRQMTALAAFPVLRSVDARRDPRIESRSVNRKAVIAQSAGVMQELVAQEPTH